MPDAPTFDLQSHSVHSDGHLPAAEVVERAAAAGVELLALSDHDTVDGVDEALSAASEHGIRVVPATELSSVDGTYDDLHVLGYLVDHHDPALLAALEEFRADHEVLGAIERFVGFGVDGVEAFYVTHTQAQTELVADECARRGLLATGSSDFHGPEHRLFSEFRAFQLFDRSPNLGPIV